MSSPLRALSLRQPWAWLVVHGGKDIENRKWRVGYRGRLLIHASAGREFTAEGMAAAEWLRRWGIQLDVPDFNDFPRGGIVGEARLAGILPRLGALASGEELPRWRMLGQYGWQLEEARPLPFVPCRGMRGLWQVPDDVLARLGEGPRAPERREAVTLESTRVDPRQLALFGGQPQ